MIPSLYEHVVLLTSLSWHYFSAMHGTMFKMMPLETGSFSLSARWETRTGPIRSNQVITDILFSISLQLVHFLEAILAHIPQSCRCSMVWCTSFLILPRFDRSSALSMLIHCVDPPRTRCRTVWGLVPLKNYPSYIKEVYTDLSGQFSPLSLYCWARQMRKSH